MHRLRVREPAAGEVVATTPRTNMIEIGRSSTRYQVPREHVLVMPEGTDFETLLDRLEVAVEACRCAPASASATDSCLWGRGARSLRSR